MIDEKCEKQDKQDMKKTIWEEPFQMQWMTEHWRVPRDVNKHRHTDTTIKYQKTQHSHPHILITHDGEKRDLEPIVKPPN